jgi:hypothetical protein
MCHRPCWQQPLHREVFELRFLHGRRPPMPHRTYEKGLWNDFSFLSPSFSIFVLRHDGGKRTKEGEVDAGSGNKARARQRRMMTFGPSLLKRHLAESQPMGPPRLRHGREKWGDVLTSRVSLNAPRPHSILAFKFLKSRKGIKTKKMQKGC